MAQIAFYVTTWKFYHDGLFNLRRRSLLYHAVVCRDLFSVLLLGFFRDGVSLVATVFFSSVYSFCSDIVSFVATDLSSAP